MNYRFVRVSYTNTNKKSRAEALKLQIRHTAVMQSCEGRKEKYIEAISKFDLFTIVNSPISRHHDFKKLC